jgi:glutathione S-transferase
MAMKLYQFPISHYCEKVRFALDYKGLDYKVKNLLPGVHRLTTSRIGKGSSVPLLSHDGYGIQGSAKIISYLDETFPERPLTPSDPSRRGEALAWESWLDAEAGVDVRLFCYNTLLKHPPVVQGFFTARGPWWSGLYVRLGYRRLSSMMRRFMNINDETAAAALVRMNSALDRLAETYAQRDYLVGGHFTRADLAAAALFAPMFRPDGYNLKWPDVELEPLDSAVRDMAPRLEWARRIYRDYR